MERNDFWKEEGYEFIDIEFDIERLNPEQVGEYLNAVKERFGIYDLFDRVEDSTIIEQFPEFFMEIVKIEPHMISRIPKSVLDKYPEVVDNIPEEVWESNLRCLNVGNVPSEMAKKYRIEVCREAEGGYSSFFNVKNLPVETVRENPWLLVEIIKSTREEERAYIIKQIPEEIKIEYGSVLDKAYEIFSKIDELHAMLDKAVVLSCEIDDAFENVLGKPLINPPMNIEKRRIGEDEDGIR